MKLVVTYFLVLFCSTLHAQTKTEKNEMPTTDFSVIKGSVIEEATGKAIPGANIKILNTKLSTISDAEGKFIFNSIAVGNYEIEFSAFTYDKKIVSDIITTKNETLEVNVSLAEKSNKLEEVVVKRTKLKTETVASLLSVQKNSVRVSDGISAETIKRTPDKTTSDVLKRISGASIQDNKFVIIRGLNDRYNTSFLNGAPLPSSEPDKKAFSFDIFPANMIDNLVIYKTASPDLPGEFAGGVIEINTKAVPDKNFQSVAIGSGYNTITTGNNQVFANGGKKDWIGLDDGTRGLPNYFPDVQAFQSLQQARTQSSVLAIDALSKNFQTDWKLNEKKFSPNTNFQFTLGRFFKRDEDSNVGFLISLSHSKTNNYNETERKSYDTPQTLLANQLDKKYSEQVLFGGIANVSFKLNANNNFSFKNLYSINSDNKVIDRAGSLTQESDPIQIHTTARLFTSNSIYSGQLAGEHYLSVSKIKINWVSSLSFVERLTPNDRSNTYSFIKFDDGTETQPLAYFSINTVGAEAPGSMYSSKNEENIHSGKIDISKKIKFSDNFNSDIKVGYFNQSRSRDFMARQLGYIPFNGNVNGQNYNGNTFSATIPFLPDATIFNSSNMGILGTNQSGLTLYDGTKNNDSYKAVSNLDAAYAMIDNGFKKFRLVWGVRMESYSQKLNSKSDAGDPIVVDDSKTDILPSVNFIYGINKKQNIRLSYSKTLNRPEFRELAPFLFYDTSTKYNTQGNQNLKIATIENFDLRYELFPGKGQLFSFSAFYKKFENPIELQALANNSNKYQNAKSGINKGIEIEYRTLISSVFGTEKYKLLNDMTFYTNLAIIRSKVDISNLVQSASIVDIPLQGQSPYVFNAGLQYINKELGWSTALNMNRIGNRIAIQGNQTSGATNPALWEKSRTFLDYQIAKSFLNNKFELKLNIQNILAQDLIFYQNNDLESEKTTGINGTINTLFTGDSQNKNAYNSAEDDVVWSTKFGRIFSFSVNYNF